MEKHQLKILKGSFRGITGFDSGSGDGYGYGYGDGYGDGDGYGYGDGSGYGYSSVDNNNGLEIITKEIV